SGNRIGLWYPNSDEKDIWGLPDLPRRVVTNMTPLAPLTPYTAVDEASFKMLMLSTSFGSSWAKSRPKTPSTTTNGAALLKVDTPRINNWDRSLPGSPLG